MRKLTSILLLVIFAISGMAQSIKNLQHRPDKKSEAKFQGDEKAKIMSTIPFNYPNAARIIANPQNEFSAQSRTWQGIPGIERTPKGRLWAVWYSGRPEGEGKDGCYALISTSGDDGKTWTEPKVAIAGPTEQSIVYDPLPWIDPTGKLWVFYCQMVMPENRIPGSHFATWAICNSDPENPDGSWSSPRVVQLQGPLFGKPFVRQDGAWIAPFYAPSGFSGEGKESVVLISTDKGQTWNYLGGTTIPKEQRSFGEGTITQRKDGSLLMVLRRVDGLSQTISEDGGRTWSDPVPLIEGPTTRSCLTKLTSGNYLLVFHDVKKRLPAPNNQFPRQNLTAWLSEDEGRTWPHKLLLDDRPRVSYPDVTQAPDGRIFIVYDNDRYMFQGDDGKEILVSIVREEDIKAGKIVSADTTLKLKVNRALGYGNYCEPIK